MKHNTNDVSTLDLLALTADIVAANVMQKNVGHSEIQKLLKHTYETLRSLAEDVTISCSVQNPAVPIEESIQDDYIICLEDGKKMKMLRRYLKTAYNMTPQQYREKWGLPPSYPMTAPSYSKRRSGLAKKIGLGKSR